MATIDTSIYSNLLRPPKSVAEYDAERMQGQSNKLALMLGQQKADEYTRSIGDEANRRQIVAKFGNDATANQNALYSGGFLKEGLELGKANADMAKTAADTGKVTVDTSKIKSEVVNMAIKRGRDQLNTVNDPQAAANWIRAQYADPELTEITRHGGSVEDAIARIPTDPQGFAKWKMESSLSAEELIKFTTPDANARLTAKTSTDNNAASNATTMRGQNMTADTAAAGRAQSERASQRTDLRARDFNILKSDENRLRLGAGKAPTEFQGKSATFGSRAAASDKIITSLGTSYSPAAINAKQGLGQIWGIGGGLEAGANLMLGDSSQKAEQAQRDFINAVLRQESGAAIADSEFTNAKKQYFPQPGDSKAVITQKAQNRKLSIQGFLNNAGRAAIPAPADAGGWSMEEVK